MKQRKANPNSYAHAVSREVRTLQAFTAALVVRDLETLANIARRAIGASNVSTH